MVYNKADFNKHIGTLQIEGYKIKSAIQASLFVRKQNNKTETITVCFRDYAPHSFYIDGVSVDIYFEEVERFLLESFNKTGIVSRWGETGTITKTFVNLPDVDYFVFDTEINNEASFMKVAAEIEKIINVGALPFFDKYNTLEKVLEESEKMPIEEMVNFIGQPLPFRRMIIKRLCDDVNYEEYANKIINNSEKKNLPELKALKVLYELLKTV
jgi:hypothetical protein